MKKHLNLIFEKHDYPMESRDFLLEKTDELYKNEKFVKLVEAFYTEGFDPWKVVSDTLEKVTEETSIHEYTVKFLYYLCVTKELREKYAEKGLSEEIYWDSVNDFKYKLLKCKQCYDIWGFHQTPWFILFLNMTQFKLGRLEFTMEKYNWEGDYEVGGLKLEKGMPILQVHIPAAKEPFSKEACYDSYNRAYHFFKEVMNYDFKCFCCGSWLLFPEHKKILKEGSNIARFLDDFKIVKVVYHENQRFDLWRIFGADADLPFEKLPRDTSLKKAYAEFLCSGAKHGEGFGIFMWDDVAKKPITE